MSHTTTTFDDDVFDDAVLEASTHASDPDVVDVAHQIATARALAGLSRQLLVIASTGTSEWDPDALPLDS